MKKKQAWKVMGAVLAGTLVFSDAVPLRASASAGTEKSAVQNETVSGTENGTETKRAAVYVNLKTGDDTADGTTAETAVKTVEKAQELLAVAAAELQADGKTTEKNTAADTSKTAAEEAAEKYLVFVGMDEKELETLKNKLKEFDRTSLLPMQKHGIGMVNIYRRLRLFYSDQLEFNVTSKKGEGTRIEILVPLDRKMEGEEHVSGILD